MESYIYEYLRDELLIEASAVSESVLHSNNRYR